MIWGAFHWVALAGNADAPLAYMAVSTLQLVAVSVILTFVFNGSRESVPVVALMHATYDTVAIGMAPLVETGMPLMAFSLTAVVMWVIAVGLIVATGGTLGQVDEPGGRSRCRACEPSIDQFRPRLRRPGRSPPTDPMARGLLGRVGPGERQVRGLVAHDPAELRDRGPVHEDPDPVRDVRCEAALEPVSKSEPRRAVDRLDEGHECLRHRELDARLVSADSAVST